MFNFFEKKALAFLAKADITLNGSKPYDIQIHDRSTYVNGVLFGSLGFADAYVAGKWDVDQIDVFFEKFLPSLDYPLNTLADIAQTIQTTLINTQIGKRAFQVGHRHYDLGNDMYSLMLGESMGYSSGIYRNASDDLTKAQYNKFDALCKKLDLQPGMRILEIGSGWGTFARHAAKEYGAKVTGLTVSKEQLAFAADRCKKLDVDFLLLDYRLLPKKYNGAFDRVVSIEMIEAVGKKNLGTYFSVIERALKPGGKAGIQAIIGSGKDDAFLSSRIFPNGHTPSSAEFINNSRKLLGLKEWSCFGKDYDRTLMAWELNFRKNWATISELRDKSGEKLYDEQFYRLWRYYLLLCAAAFRVGLVDVAQIVLQKTTLGLR